MTELDPKHLARQAFDRAEQLERNLLARWPNLWQQLDQMAADPPVSWPEWCLLPMAAPAGAMGASPGKPPPPIGVASALYAWRRCRSVYILEPALTARLLEQVPDAIGLEDLTGLPEWCVYVGAGQAGVWIHLEHDINTGRPELRLLLDIPEVFPAPMPIPVYLDRPTVTEALADFRATAAEQLTSAPGQNVRGAQLDEIVARFAGRIDTYLGIAAYLARPEADIAEAGRPGVRPAPRRGVAKGRTVWLVGYGDERS